MTFRPSAALDAKQQTALEMNYGMEASELKCVMRRAMRIYALRRLGFVQDPLTPPMLNELEQLEWVDASDLG